YIVYLHSLLRTAGINLNSIKYYSRIDKRYGSINESVYFKSHNLETLNFLSEMFIYNGTKVVPLNIKDWLTPISLAH
ncbi:MAG: hypothetical protein FE78DRAFT_156096, partial [Acidomyces sp. 'richmondensis']